MKHPPSKTIGPKLWLAKAWPNVNALCPSPSVHLENGNYSFSPANFDPRKMSLPVARIAGKKTTLFPPYGALFGAQIWRMAHEAKNGDWILLESENRHLHAWGIVIEEYDKGSGEKLSETALTKEGLHRIGVEWHKIKGGQNAFRLGRGDNLLFREVPKDNKNYAGLLKFVDKKIAQGPVVTKNPDMPLDLEYYEGGKKLRLHLSIERDSRASDAAKNLARKRYKDGKLRCDSCACIPENDYNGLDLIEAHHSIPLAAGSRLTKSSDFVMLCPNCHRAVHKLINDNVDPLKALDLVSKIFN